MSPRAEQVRLRPSLVVVAELEDDTTAFDTTTAVLPLPADLSAPARRVAEAMAMRASVRLLGGDTLDFALCRVVGGRDSLAADLQFGAQFSGEVALSRQTVARALDELVDLGVLDRVGQLPGWMDMQADGGPRSKLGAFVYALNLRCPKLGDRVQEAMHKAARQALSGLAGALSPLSATVRTTGHGRRLDGCLNWAIGAAETGTRNGIGHWLACRCIEAGLSEGETMKVLSLYRANVPQNPSYTAREAVATVRSRYRRKVNSMNEVFDELGELDERGVR